MDTDSKNGEFCLKNIHSVHNSVLIDMSFTEFTNRQTCVCPASEEAGSAGRCKDSVWEEKPAGYGAW